MSIQEQIFQAIDIITDKKVRELKFDKTVEGLVVSDAKAETGEYEVQYQDIRFTAYSSNNTVKYKKDENVLILIPDGDMSNKKTILSSSKSEGERYVDIDDIIADKLGINFVDEEEGFEINLSTYVDDQKTFKVKTSQMVTLYPGQKMLWIGADIYSNISTDFNGDYGIEVECVFADKDNNKYNHTYKLSLVDMVGNPYQSRGYKYTQLPLMEDRLVDVLGARAFSTGFRGGFENIKMSNIEIEYVKAREQDGSEYTGNIIAPKGLHFKNEILFPSEVLDLIMQFKQKGQVLDSDAVDYKWFIMDPNITSTEDDRYSPDAGLGWKMLLPGDYPDDILGGVGTKALQVWASFVPSFETFKCIAYYKNYIASDMVTVVDHTDEVKLDMTSTNGASFVNGVGETDIICTVKQGGEEIEKELIYSWSKAKEDGVVVPIKVGNDNRLHVLASEIGIKTNYICEVGVTGATRPIATGNIALVNLTDGATHGIIVVGGFRTALYDADGNSPEIKTDGFQFDFYKNGEKVLENIKWKWSIPKQEETLLTMPSGTVESDGRRTSTDKVLFLNLEKSFSLTKGNNTLTIDVEHAENGIVTTTREVVNISITKVGNNGADGSAGKPGIDGKTYVYEIQGGTPTVIYDKNGLNPNPSKLNEFYLMFSEDGNNALAKEVDQVRWGLETSRTSALSFEGTSSRYVVTKKTEGSENPHKVTLVPDATWVNDKYNNFLSAEITYKGMIFREYYPVAITKNGSDGAMGYTVTTLPSNVVFKFDEDGVVTGNRDFIINFKINDGAGTPIDFTVQSISNGVDGLSIIKTQDNKGLSVSVREDLKIPESAQTEIVLVTQDGKTFSQIVSFTSIRDGNSAYTVLLTNTSHMFPINPVTGNMIPGVEVETIAEAYHGTTKLENVFISVKRGFEDERFRIDAPGTTNRAKITTIGKTRVTNVAEDLQGVIPFVISISDVKETFSQDFSWAVTSKGVDGDSATSYWLDVSDAVIVKAFNHINEIFVTPSVITLKAMKQTGKEKPVNWTADAKVQVSVNDGAPQLVKNGIFNIPTDVRSLKFELFVDDVIVDSQTIRVIQEQKETVIMKIQSDTDVIRNGEGTVTLNAIVIKNGSEFTEHATKQWYNSQGPIRGETGNSLVVTADMVGSSEMFKCEATIDGVKYSDVKTIWDVSDPILVEVRSDGGDKFQNGEGSSVVQCIVWRNGEEIDKDGQTYDYVWKKFDANRNPVPFSPTKEPPTSNTYKTIKIVNSIDMQRKATFACEVYSK